MSCVVFHACSCGKLHVAADSAYSDDRTKILVSTPKFMESNGIVYGVAGSLLPLRKFIEADGAGIHNAEEAAELLTAESEQSDFLVSDGREIWLVSDGDSVLCSQPFCAIGSGLEVALGYLVGADISDDGLSCSSAETAAMAAASLSTTCDWPVEARSFSCVRSKVVPSGQ